MMSEVKFPGSAGQSVNNRSCRVLSSGHDEVRGLANKLRMTKELKTERDSGEGNGESSAYGENSSETHLITLPVMAMLFVYNYR